MFLICRLLIRMCVLIFTVCGWCVCVFSAYSEDDLSDAFSKESCITEQTQYFFENENKSFSGAMDCGNCSRWGLFLCLYVHKSIRIPSNRVCVGVHVSMCRWCQCFLSVSSWIIAHPGKSSLQGPSSLAFLLFSLPAPHALDPSDVQPAVNPAGRAV